jgi:hypothetical protein
VPGAYSEARLGYAHKLAPQGQHPTQRTRISELNAHGRDKRLRLAEQVVARVVAERVRGRAEADVVQGDLEELRGRSKGR